MAVVHLRIRESLTELEDEFPEGEQHFRVPLDAAQVMEAFTLDRDGIRHPLTPLPNKTSTAFPGSPANGPRHPRSTPAAGRPGGVGRRYPAWNADQLNRDPDRFTALNTYRPSLGRYNNHGRVAHPKLGPNRTGMRITSNRSDGRNRT